MLSKFVGELRAGDEIMTLNGSWSRVVKVRYYGTDRIIDSADEPPLVMKATALINYRPGPKTRSNTLNIIEARIDALGDAAQAAHGQIPREELPSLMARLSRVQRLIENATT